VFKVLCNKGKMAKEAFAIDAVCEFFWQLEKLIKNDFDWYLNKDDIEYLDVLLLAQFKENWTNPLNDAVKNVIPVVFGHQLS
jgi:hypothetical protein